MTVPSKENVDFVGEFKPSAYGFRKNEYWGQKQLKTVYFLSITPTFYIKKAPHKMRSFVRDSSSHLLWIVGFPYL